MTTTTYAADGTALLIVDPYNDFMSEGGKPSIGMSSKRSRLPINGRTQTANFEDANQRNTCGMDANEKVQDRCSG